MLISDHINLTGRSPILGANFVDLTDLYSRRLRALCREVDPSLDEGVYVQFPGPHYETPAEVRMAGVLGGQLVGMSTTLEAIAAREAGMEVLGISLVTNLAAGITSEPLNHAEVLEAGQAAAARMGSLLSQVVPKLTTQNAVRAARVVANGEPADVVEVEDVEVPEPGAGQVRVAVSAASLNFGDIARCRGGVAAVMAQPPFTLGMDVCGLVDAAGPGAEEWVGQRVVGITPQSLGGLAERALAGSWWPAPPELSDVEAAAFTLPFHVSHLALHERAALREGETVLVRGGASAVGTAAIQLAVAAGARVLAVAGGREKAALCTELGAARAVDHTAEDAFDVVMDETGDRGADVIFDPIGGTRPRCCGPAARSAAAISRSASTTTPSRG